MKKKFLLISTILIISILLVLPLFACEKEVEPEVKIIPYKFVDGSTVFIEMGEYPQTIAEDVTVADIKTNGTYDESTGYYTYNENKYKIITASPDAGISEPTFSNGESVVAGTEYAFKVETIIWKIINKQLKEDDYLLYANKILDSTHYQEEENYGASTTQVVNYYLYDENHQLQIEKEVYANNYEYSTLRNTLTSFYNIAFSEDNKTAIKKITVDNTSEKASPVHGDDYFPRHQNDTEDYVFALSKFEATYSRYGFTEEDKARRFREVTDYAIARGVFYIQNSSGLKSGWIWTRTSGTYSNMVYYLNTLGEIKDRKIINEDALGVVPAVRVEPLK